jgi:AraC-like DNA-binding protein
MKEKAAVERYLIDEISLEHFIGEHYFIYVIKGIATLYDGYKYMELRAGECGIARKNRLGRYFKTRVNNELEKVILAFDGVFLKQFQERHQISAVKFHSAETFIPFPGSDLLPDYIRSLGPYYDQGKIEEPFSDVKREELLFILLRTQPELTGLLFDYGMPEKANLEEFMIRNYKFNVSTERFAFLTGRSLSAFKRDFKTIFGETPNRWLILKRLKEAHFLLEKDGKKPSEIYLDLGFETLSHFSFAFKKHFGLAPTALVKSNME